MKLLTDKNSLRPVISLLLIILFLIGNNACTPKTKTANTKIIRTQKGIASWYGTKFNGKLTASGEIFDMTKLTAAHKKLAFGTLIKVQNTKNNKSVIVRINDRGPFAKNRIIDLSKEAANRIDMLNDGLSEVTLHIVGYQGKGLAFINTHIKNLFIFDFYNK